MSRYVFKLPDLGEGTVEAEIVGWRVKPGDTVAEDDVLVEMMTEKAAVEVPSPVSGRVVSTTGAPGEMVPVGAELIVLDTSAAGGTTAAAVKPAAATASAAPNASAAAAPVRTAAPVAAPAAAAAAPPRSPAPGPTAASCRRIWRRMSRAVRNRHRCAVPRKRCQRHVRRHRAPQRRLRPRRSR